MDVRKYFWFQDEATLAWSKTVKRSIDVNLIPDHVQSPKILIGKGESGHQHRYQYRHYAGRLQLFLSSFLSSSLIFRASGSRFGISPLRTWLVHLSSCLFAFTDLINFFSSDSPGPFRRFFWLPSAFLAFSSVFSEFSIVGSHVHNSRRDFWGRKVLGRPGLKTRAFFSLFSLLSLVQYILCNFRSSLRRTTKKSICFYPFVYLEPQQSSWKRLWIITFAQFLFQNFFSLPFPRKKVCIFIAF